MAAPVTFYFKIWDDKYRQRYSYHILLSQITNFYIVYPDGGHIEDGTLVICVGNHRGDLLYHPDDIYTIPKKAGYLLYRDLLTLLPNQDA